MPMEKTAGAIVVRYTDEFVMGLQYFDDARSMLEDLSERLAKFKLTLRGTGQA